MFANRIKFLRKSKGWNQTQLAEKLGVTKQSISNWENDNIMPSVEMLVRVANLSQVSTDYLVGNEKDKPDNIHLIDVTGLTPEEIEHIQIIVNDLRKK